MGFVLEGHALEVQEDRISHTSGPEVKTFAWRTDEAASARSPLARSGAVAASTSKALVTGPTFTV
jgi:hypothetical protein